MVRLYWVRKNGSILRRRVMSSEKADTLMFFMNAKGYIYFYCEGIYELS
jgi:hypothetical protein